MANSVKSVCNTALLIVDMISDFEFEDGEKLCPHAAAAAENIRELKIRAKRDCVPVIYVNDNYGRWNEDFRTLATRLSAGSDRGSRITEMLRPEENDLYILKPQRSGFYETPLSVLLQSLRVSNLIICGVTTDICVLFTAHDAYMRGFRVYVPSDCSAAVEVKFHTDALELMERVADARIGSSCEIDFEALNSSPAGHDIARNIPNVATELGSAGSSS
jgi:nicotinamidase-related amidase